MRQKINEVYKEAAVEFARRVTLALRDQVDAIVLYGSVARGEAKRDSDIDILVVSPDSQIARKKLSEIRSDFAYERNYSFFISLVDYNREELYKLRQLGSPFLQNVIKEGLILYDNGTFSRVCQTGVTAS
jgi:predicted nucleotidyltransferase